jgi:uncharacterized membrane protein
MLHAAKKVNGRTLWANMHLLFWLSLVPFVTGWMGENNFATWPVVLYGLVLLMAAIAYYFLAHSLIRLEGKESPLGRAFGTDWKGIISPIVYVTGIGLSFIHPWLGFATYAMVAAIWFIPDQRIEKKLAIDKSKNEE